MRSVCGNVDVCKLELYAGETLSSYKRELE